MCTSWLPEAGQARALRAAAPEAAQQASVQSMHAAASEPPSQPLSPVTPRAVVDRAAPRTTSNSVPVSMSVELRPSNDVPPAQPTAEIAGALPARVPPPERGDQVMQPSVPAVPPRPAAGRAANPAPESAPHAATPTIVHEPAIRELSERILREVEPARARPQPPEPFRRPVMAQRRQDPQPTVRIGSIRLDVRAPEAAPAQPAAPARSDPPPRPVPLRRFHVRTW